MTMHYIGVIQKHVTVLMGRCAQFGKLIRKRKENTEVVGVGWKDIGTALLRRYV